MIALEIKIRTRKRLVEFWFCYGNNIKCFSIKICRSENLFRIEFIFRYEIRILDGFLDFKFCRVFIPFNLPRSASSSSSSPFWSRHSSQQFSTIKLFKFWAKREIPVPFKCNFFLESILRVMLLLLTRKRLCFSQKVSRTRLYKGFRDISSPYANGTFSINTHRPGRIFSTSGGKNKRIKLDRD